MKIEFKKLYPTAKVPTKTYKNDAGFDLYALGSTYLESMEQKIIDCGISINIPDGYFGLFRGRSGLASKNGIIILGGVIDAGFEGQLRVIMYNASNKIMFIQAQDRIAQMLILPVINVEFTEVKEFSNISIRGTNGWGSSGV